MRHRLRSFVAALVVVLGGSLTAPSTASAVGLGQFCGGIAAFRCDRGLFCERAPGTCRFPDFGGICVRIPRICTFVYRPVCGCNGKTYSNDCIRQRARVSKLHDGPCRRP
jgi:hypothetical protein